MNIKWALLNLLITFHFIGCKDDVQFPKLEVQIINNSTVSSGQSRLVTDQDGSAFLSWIEYNGTGADTDTFVLQYSRLLEDDTWDKPGIIAKSNSWFINWADFPSLAIYNDDGLAAHWLAMRDVGTYEYDVHVSSSDDGKLWSNSFIPHRDSLAAEHGFATMIPLGPSAMIASWLDGRNTVQKGNVDSSEGQGNVIEEGHGHGSEAGAMTLRTATFDQNGNISQEFELDHMICDCCQTDMAMTKNGPVIVYRDRTENEIRDISIVRLVEDRWTTPKSVYNDHWHINGCPVNGPAVDAVNDQVAVAWYSAANGMPKVQLALSTDGGANFDLPLHIDKGDPLGRVDVKWINNQQCIVTWLENGEDGVATIQARFASKDGTLSQSQELIHTHSSRRSGFPIIAKDKNGILITWTEIQEEKSVIRTARIL